MNNNNNNGRGIFYGVIGVATLVVAIIGATFAYFSATITQNNAINVASTVVKLEIGAQYSNFKTNMIPVNTYAEIDEDTGAKTGIVDDFYSFPGLATTKCVDLVGNSICSVYQVEVKNPEGSATQTIEGSLTPVANTGLTDMEYAVFSGSAATIEAKNGDLDYDVHGTPSAATQAGSGNLIYQGKIGGVDAIGTAQAWGTNSRVQLAGGQSTVYTIVLWLEDTGKEQDVQQGKVFAAGVTFKSAQGSEVTGVITAS